MLKNLNFSNSILIKILITFIFLITSSLFSLSVKAADQTVEMLNKLGISKSGGLLSWKFTFLDDFYGSEVSL